MYRITNQTYTQKKDGLIRTTEPNKLVLSSN